MKKDHLFKTKKVLIMFMCFMIFFSFFSVAHADAHEVILQESIETPVTDVYTDYNEPYKETLLINEDGYQILLTRIVSGDYVLVTAEDMYGTILHSALTSFNMKNIITRDISGAIKTVSGSYESSPTNPALSLRGDWGTESYVNWNVGAVASVAGLAVSIACATSGITLSVAYIIATYIVEKGLSYIWAKTGISMRYDLDYTYCRRRTWFYKNAARTALVYGPTESIQRKSNQY